MFLNVVHFRFDNFLTIMIPVVLLSCKLFCQNT